MSLAILSILALSTLSFAAAAIESRVQSPLAKQ